MNYINISIKRILSKENTQTHKSWPVASGYSGPPDFFFSYVSGWASVLWLFTSVVEDGAIHPPVASTSRAEPKDLRVGAFTIEELKML